MADDPTGDPTCRVCENYINTTGEFACYECMAKLKALMTSVTALDGASTSAPSYAYSPSIELKNVRLSTDYPGEAIVAIDGSGATGVQKPFKFDGQGKCIVCDELTTDTLVCHMCRDAIELARGIAKGADPDAVEKFVDVMMDEGTVALLRFVTTNAMKKYMEAEIEQFGES